MSSTFDPFAEIRFQLMWNRLISVVEEQATTLVRTSFSTSTREAGDVSAGIFGTDARMIAQAVTGTPGHVNAMARAVGHFVEKFGLDGIFEGDVYITNDPWLGTGHLNDFTVVTPTYRDGRLIAFFACTVHVVDIGGRGTLTEARQVYEEGLYVPIIKLASKGSVSEVFLDIVRANVRQPDLVVGDLYSLITGNEIGGQRLTRMMSEFGLDDLEELAGYIFDRSREASLAAIRALPRGRWTNRMTVDGMEQPIELVASLTIAEDGIDIDFTGTSGCSSYGINVPICYAEAYASFGAKCLVAPHVPNNAASLATIRVTAPENCILNAPHPSPVTGRGIIGQMLPDVVMGCLSDVVPGGVMAEGTSCLWNLSLTGGVGRVEALPEDLKGATPFMVMPFHSGGTGARPCSDGLSATAFPSGVKNVPVEVTETQCPLIIWRKEFRSDSAGAGTWRGGLGQIMEIENGENYPFAISANFDRVVHPARGRQGGKPGATGRLRLSSGKVLAGKGHQTIPARDRLIVEMPGGGGIGSPHDRDPADVERDVMNGFVSQTSAKVDYAVVVDAKGRYDLVETAEFRRSQRGAATR